jgi:hypothetical protein
MDGLMESFVVQSVLRGGTAKLLCRYCCGANYVGRQGSRALGRKGFAKSTSEAE